MNSPECRFEADVLAAVLESSWPEPLKAHVSQCEVCGQLASVAHSIRILRQETRAVPNLPDAGRVWWLAQMRKRRESIQTAGRPITVAQVLAFACALALICTFFEAAFPMLWAHWLLTAVVAALLLLAPVSVYLVGGKD